MSKIKLFNNEVTVRSHYCSLFNMPPEVVNEPYTSLYVRSKGCDARCKFCIWYNSAEKFDDTKYISILEEISNKVKLNKIVFTGGEPTLNWEEFKKRVTLARKYFPKSLIYLDTNGYNLKRLFNDDIIKQIDSVALSRHHYKDSINNEIFKVKVASSRTIKSIQSKSKHKDKLHLTCNLIKGNIDSVKEIFKYFEYVSSLGVTSTSIIELMPVNPYSKKNYVTIKMSDLLSDRFFVLKEWTYEDKCFCKNYVYVSKDLITIKVYQKNTFKPFEMLTGLTFDGKVLKEGFNGKIIF